MASSSPQNVSEVGPAPEPGPDWPVARTLWGSFWQCHWAGIGAAFAALAVLSLFRLFTAGRGNPFTRKPLFIAVNSLLLGLGLARALYLWIDPYESGEHGFKCYIWMVRILFGIAFPCLTSAFCIIHVAFIEASKIEIGPKRLHSVPFVASIIVLHFVIVIVSDCTVAFEADKTELLIVCQSFFIAWGFINSLAFLYSGPKVILSARDAKKQLRQVGHTSDKESKKSNTTKVAKITLVTCFLGFACCGLQLYSLLGVYSVYSTEVDPQPWPWLAFQTSFRLVELFMGWAIAYTVQQPAEKNKSTKAWSKLDRVWKSRSDVSPSQVATTRKSTDDVALKEL